MPPAPATCALPGCALIAPARRKFCSPEHAKQGLRDWRSQRGRQLAIEGHAKMRQLRAAGPGFDRARASKTIATRDARDPGWRARFGEIARASQGKIHQTMTRRHGVHWRKTLGQKARGRRSPHSDEHRANLSRAQRSRVQRDGAEAHLLALRIRAAKTSTELLILEDSLRTVKARAMVRTAMKHRPGPTPTYTLAEIRADVRAGKTVKQIAARFSIGERRVQQLLSLL